MLRDFYVTLQNLHQVGIHQSEYIILTELKNKITVLIKNYVYNFENNILSYVFL